MFGAGNVKNGHAMLDSSHSALRRPMGPSPWGGYGCREKPRSGRLPVRKPLSDQPSPGESLYGDKKKAENRREGDRREERDGKRKHSGCHDEVALRVARRERALTVFLAAYIAQVWWTPVSFVQFTMNDPLHPPRFLVFIEM